MVSSRPPTSKSSSPFNSPLVIIPCEFFTPAQADGLSQESEGHQVSRTLLRILVDLNHAVVWMISARPPISNSSSPLTKPLGIILSAPIKTRISITFMFHSFFLSSQARSKYILIFSFLLIFTPWSARTTKSTIQMVLFLFIFYFFYLFFFFTFFFYFFFFLLIITWSGPLARIR